MIICRTCLKTKPKEKCTNISPTEEDEKSCNLLEMISYSIPELDIFVVKNPVICDSCIATLEVSFKFKTECLKNQEKLLQYSSNINAKVDLPSIYSRLKDQPEYNNNHYESTIEQSMTSSNRLDQSEGQYSLICENCPGCKLKITGDPSVHTKINIGPFICFHCNKELEDIFKLRKHILCHVRQRKCKICSKSFRDLDNLKRHLRVHTLTNPFKCNICLKEFRQKHNLTQHINQHVRSEKLTCTYCQKVYSTKYNLEVHLKKTHQQKQYCDLCGESFSTKSELVEHLHMLTETCGTNLMMKKEIKQESNFHGQDTITREIKIDPETICYPDMDQIDSGDQVESQTYLDVVNVDIKPCFSGTYLLEDFSQTD